MKLPEEMKMILTLAVLNFPFIVLGVCVAGSIALGITIAKVLL